jgi:hypothetical protein
VFAQVREDGCSVGAGAEGQSTGGVVTGTVSLDGQCYQKTRSTDNTEFIYIGAITVGRCFDLFSGGCQPGNCRNGSPGQRCNDNVPGCTVYPSARTVCSTGYTVVAGDSCWAIANANGKTLDDLRSLNPGVNCDNLQIHQMLCLATAVEWGAGTRKCEGAEV